MILKEIPNISALVPMRHKSERIEGKNYRLFAGIPLYHHILKTLFNSKYIKNVWINTDSQVIQEDAPKDFPVNIIPRPDHLCSEFESMNNILIHDVKQINSEYFIQTHSTNPLLTSETIDRAIELFFSEDKYDSLFSVTRLQTRLYYQNGNAINHDPRTLARTQDLNPVFEENSNLYLFTKENLIKNKNRIGSNPLMFEIDRLEALDIDEEHDFMFAEFLYTNRIK